MRSLIGPHVGSQAHWRLYVELHEVVRQSFNADEHLMMQLMLRKCATSGWDIGSSRPRSFEDSYHNLDHLAKRVVGADSIGFVHRPYACSR
jgi:hypothetical protein